MATESAANTSARLGAGRGAGAACLDTICRLCRSETTGSADQRGVTGADVRGLVEVLEVTRADHADALLRWAEVGKPCLLLQPADRPEVLAAEYGPRRRHRPDFA